MDFNIFVREFLEILFFNKESKILFFQKLYLYILTPFFGTHLGFDIFLFEIPIRIKEYKPLFLGNSYG